MNLSPSRNFSSSITLPVSNRRKTKASKQFPPASTKFVAVEFYRRCRRSTRRPWLCLGAIRPGQSATVRTFGQAAKITSHTFARSNNCPASGKIVHWLFFFRLGVWKTKQKTPHRCLINQTCFGVEMDTVTPSQKRKGIKSCWCAAHDEICGRIQSESQRGCLKFTFPWRVEGKTIGKWNKKRERNLNFNNETWKAAGKWGGRPRHVARLGHYLLLSYGFIKLIIWL